jgi:phenylalanyl-tRNA synthetase beta chain
VKFTLSWLKEHLDTDAALEDIIDKLTLIGLEVEDVFDPAAVLAPFTVVEVLNTKQHPDADRLRVCEVKTRDGVVQVVCGAPNARSGMKGIFGASGTYIPGINLTLKPAKIRGVESNGMLLTRRSRHRDRHHAEPAGLSGCARHRA